jgi:hypothetical protein
MNDRSEIVSVGYMVDDVEKPSPSIPSCSTSRCWASCSPARMPITSALRDA